jgi:hypothetical protein
MIDLRWLNTVLEIAVKWLDFKLLYYERSSVDGRHF